jgi:hypothetical protein
VNCFVTLSGCRGAFKSPSGAGKINQSSGTRTKVRSTSTASGAVTCSFCGEPGSTDRLLVGDDEDCTICITLAVARIAEARGRLGASQHITTTIQAAANAIRRLRMRSAFQQ